jgi:hypothetical protein
MKIRFLAVVVRAVWGGVIMATALAASGCGGEDVPTKGENALAAADHRAGQ